MQEKTDRGGWRERVPLIERAVETLRPSDVHEAVQRPDVPVRADAGPVRVPDRSVAAAKPSARRSRFAEVDLARLESLGLLAPATGRSRAKEEYRVIKRSVLHNAFQPGAARRLPNNLVMVSSARPGEGKTFTAINLAISIASERDYTVLLVDADFTKPSVLSTLGLEADRGMVDVLEDPTIDLADVMIRTNIDKLTILPAGHAHALSTELLASQRMKDLVADIARRYHDRIVIFDAPPILATSEPCALAMHMGQIVFVVEADKTPKSAVREALDLIDTGPRIGVVLNRSHHRFGQTEFGSYYQR